VQDELNGVIEMRRVGDLLELGFRSGVGLMN